MIGGETDREGLETVATERSGDAHAAGDAEGGEAVLTAAALQLVHQRRFGLPGSAQLGACARDPGPGWTGTSLSCSTPRVPLKTHDRFASVWSMKDDPLQGQ